MELFEPGFDGLPFEIGEVYRGMGYGDGEPDADMKAMVGQVLEEAVAVCRPRFGYEILPAEGIEARAVTIGGRRITTGTIITPFFTEAESFALFVATAGVEYDRWLHDIKRSGDILREFVADSIGSEIAEACGRLLSAQLEERMAREGMKISNSYSPGYCGWHVTEQQNLFALLPPRPCGITLGESSLMSPVKSISGLIAIGARVEKMPYGCALCGKKDCYKNREKLKTQSK